MMLPEKPKWQTEESPTHTVILTPYAQYDADLVPGMQFVPWLCYSRCTGTTCLATDAHARTHVRTFARCHGKPMQDCHRFSRLCIKHVVLMT